MNQAKFLSDVTVGGVTYTPHKDPTKSTWQTVCVDCGMAFIVVTENLDVLVNALHEHGWIEPNTAHWMCPTCKKKDLRTENKGDQR